MTVSPRFSGREDATSRKDLLNTYMAPDRRDDSGASSGEPPPQSARPAGTPNRRISAVQATEIIEAIGGTGRLVVEILAATRYASGAQIRRLLWADSDSGRRLGRYHLNKLTDLQVLDRLGRRVGGARAGSDGYIYALGVVGQRMATIDGQTFRRPATPGLPFIRHTLGVTEIYIQLRAAQAAGHIELVDFAAEPDSWRQYRYGGRSQIIKPDAYAHWLDDKWEHAACFEIDMATEHPGRITKKSQAYADWHHSTDDTGDIFPRVVWIGPDHHRTEVLAAAVAEVDDADYLFDITTPAGFERSLQPTTDTREEVNS